MPKHTPHSERINAAAGIIKNHPTLTAAMAMKLAGFSEEDCSNPSLHALVRRRLPGRGKRAYQKTLPALSTPSPPAAKEPPIAGDIVVAAGEGSEGSPLTNPTFDPPVPAPPKKMRLTLTTKQKQDVCAAQLKKKEVYKAAHKAATVLYALERSKEGGGMTVRQVEAIVKKKFHGIGPSKSTIQHYVVDLKIKGESPKKRGPVGYISQVAYKALCVAFASMLRINQLNSKTNARRTQIRWLMNAMRYTNSEATELWKRIRRDTADEHMQVNKVKCAEERRVKWTTYQNLDLWFDSWEKVLDDL